MYVITEKIMAERKVINMVQEIITCSICVEVIDDPRILQCQHVYCYKCLVKYLKSKRKQDEIECPLCRKVCPIPNKNLGELPVSFLYNQLKDANKTIMTEDVINNKEDIPLPKRIPVCSTSECSGRKASKFCEACSYICSECEKDHEKVPVLRRHVILSLEKAMEEDQNRLPPCPKHPREVMKLYCEDCELPMCLLCYPLNHPQHKCSEITDKSKQAKEQLKQIIQTINTDLGKSKERSDLLKKHSTKISGAATDFRKHISTTLDNLQKQLDDRKKIINEGAAKKYALAHLKLVREAERINALQKTLKSIQVCSTNLLLHGTPCDFLKNVSSIQQRLKSSNPNGLRLTLEDMDLAELRQQLDDVKVTVVLP